MKKSKSRKSTAENESLQKPDHEDFLVAGIGASAGGIQALKEFFENVPADSGVAYVVILHLSPDHESRLAEVLQTTAQIPVTQVNERVKVEPNHVYVMPPNQHLEMLDGHIGVEQNVSFEARRAPVDIFFRTLAEARQAGAIAVVLSGTGADGSMGLKRVKECGGVVFVQNPREAEFSEMPRNSIATELVDQVLNVGEIPAKIVAYKANLGADATENIIQSDEPLARRLEAELERTKARLATSVEQYEAQTEELRASNEELQTTNEEMRSTAEELETSREELQSVNEELMTVNDELKSSVNELSKSNDDFKNLLNSTDIGTIFLDCSLRVKMFTPSAREVFNLIDADINRSLADITTKLVYADLHTDVERVLETLQAVEREFETDKGRWYLMRVYPYRTREDKISGAVVTFVDITNRKKSEEKLAQSEKQFRAIVNQAAAGIAETDLTGKLLLVNDSYQEMLGYSRSELLDLRIEDITHPDDYPRNAAFLEKLYADGEPFMIEKRYVGKNGETIWVCSNVAVITDAANRPLSTLIVSVDITERKKTEEKLSASLEQLSSQSRLFDTTLSTINDFVYIFDRDGRFIYSNQPLLDLLEITLEEIKGKNFYDLDYPEDLAARLQSQIQQVFDTRQTVSDETPFTSPTGANGFYEYIFNPVLAADGSVESVVGSTRDITKRKQSEAALEEAHQRLQMAMRAGRIFSWEMNPATRQIEWSDNTASVIGFPLSERLDKTYATIHPDDARNTIDQIDRAIETGGVYESEFRLINPANGEAFWFHSQGAVTKKTADRQPRFVGITQNTTERKQAEKALRESEEKFRSFVNVTSDVVYQISADWRELRSLDGKDFIHSTSEANENWLAEYIPETDRRQVSDDIEKAIQTRTVYESEHRVNRLDGSIGWAFSRAIPVLDERGEIVEWLGAASDITTRKQAEQALRESETQMRLVVEAAEMGTWDWNLKSGAVRWNDQHFRLFGREPENRILSYKDFEQGVHPDDREMVREQLEESIETDKVYQTEFRAVLPDGSTRWMSGYGRVIEHDRDGRAARMTGVMFDVTERKATEEEVLQSKERLRLLVESASDYAIFTVTSANIIDSWNAGAEAVFGYTESEIIGRSGEILFTREDQQNDIPRGEIETARREGRAEDERWHIRKDGTRFYASGVMRPLADGQVKGFVKIARDQTERLRAEKAVSDRETLRRIVGAQEEERRRIARDLHDHLGQQMTALRLKLANAREICDDAPLCEKLNDINETAERIDADVGFLAWELRPAALDDLGLVAALDNYIKEWTRHTGVRAEFYAAHLKHVRLTPEAETNLYRITQEALNNTYKHASANSASVMVERRGSLVVLIIEDDGNGFDVEDKQTRDKGIGLLGMGERAALIGGKIQIESTPQKGTTVFVRIPLKDENQPE